MIKCMGDVKAKYANNKLVYMPTQFIIAVVTILAIGFGTMMTMSSISIFASGCLLGCTAEQVDRRDAVNDLAYPVLIAVCIISFLVFIINLVRLSTKSAYDYNTAYDYIKYAKLAAEPASAPKTANMQQQEQSEQSEPIDISGGIFSPDENKEK